MNDRYQYGGVPAEVKSAGGVRGMIIRSLDGVLMFRVYHDRERYADYEIRHDNLGITIDADVLAAFYRAGERDILDHSPDVLGLKRVEG